MERKKTYAENPIQVVSRLSAAHGSLRLARQKMDDTPTNAQKKQLSAAASRFRAQIDYASSRPDVKMVLSRYILDLITLLPESAEAFVTDIDTAMARINRKNNNGKRK